jgi:hypothetical protein
VLFALRESDNNEPLPMAFRRLKASDLEQHQRRPETAIRIARAAEMPLHIAAKVPRTERDYFEEQLEPQIDGKQVRLIGEVDENAG